MTRAVSSGRLFGMNILSNIQRRARRLLKVAPLLAIPILPMQACDPVPGGRPIPNAQDADCSAGGYTITVSKCYRLEQNGWRQRAQAWCPGTGWAWGPWRSGNGQESILLCPGGAIPSNQQSTVSYP